MQRVLVNNGYPFYILAKVCSFYFIFNVYNVISKKRGDFMNLLTATSLSITEKDISLLKELQLKLNTQDNYCTSYPVWRVFKRKLILGVNIDACDGMCIINTDTDKIYLKLDDLVNDLLCVLTDENGDPYPSMEWFLNDIGEDMEINSLDSCYDFIVNILGWDNYEYVPYSEEFIFIDQFLTESASNSFVSNNSHRYNCNLTVRVESSWNNPELVSLINIIKNL